MERGKRKWGFDKWWNNVYKAHREKKELKKCKEEQGKKERNRRREKETEGPRMLIFLKMTPVLFSNTFPSPEKRNSLPSPGGKEGGKEGRF
jgi:hypothetical protein